MTNDLALTYDPLDDDVRSDPYPYYAALREGAPVFWLDSLRSFVVSRYDDVRRVMHDHNTFSSEAMGALVSRPVECADAADVLDEYDRSDFPNSIVGLDGAAHSRLRMIVNRGFTPKRIGVLEAEMRHTARTFVRPLVTAGSGDLQAGLAVPFPTTVIAQLLGVPIKRRDDFRRWSEWMVRGVFEPLDPLQQNEVANAGREMGEYLAAIIEERGDGRGDDLISVLLDAEPEGGALTPQELEVFVFTLLVAGSITTAYLIGRAAQLLAGDPALLASTRADRTRVPMLIEETLRYDTPVQLMFRTASSDVEIADMTIPSGATVIALLGSANRDPSMFNDPDRFDPVRGTTEHLSFGRGVHFCLGAALARLEPRIALEELLVHAAVLEPAGDAEVVSSIVFRGPTTLPLRFRQTNEKRTHEASASEG
jgi:cytochrome P450